jgi:elongation factor Ts
MEVILMEITASMVKELREKTNAGMMDCKKALKETNGDIEKAIVYLREKGLLQAAKKSSRIASEGLTTALISADEKKGVVIEVNSETDFVAKNEEFKSFVEETAKAVLDNDPKDLEALKALVLKEGKTVQEVLTDKIATIGENMSLRRFGEVKVDKGLVVDYIHGGGKISVLVALESEGDKEVLKVLGKDIAMQVAAMSPKYISMEDVDEEFIAQEKEILTAQALNEGKPQNIVEKMVLGRLNKELKEICLLEQAFVKDPDLTVKKVISDTAKKIGSDIKVAGVIRYEVYKKVGVLSGGEQIKVSFAKILLQDINLLILDEPTNYLDINSLEVMEDTLKDYDRTLLFVSHDRSLITKVATQIMTVENYKIKCFNGTYAEFHEKQNKQKQNGDISMEIILLENRLSQILGRLSMQLKKEELEALDKEYLEISDKLKELRGI